MVRRTSLVVACFLALATGLCLAIAPRMGQAGEEWTEFRGPQGQGHSTATGLPVTWSEMENVVWKVPLDGLGWSSPVIKGDQLWLTTATEEGKSLRAICLNPATGQRIHDVEVFRLEDPGHIHSKNSHASPTPLLEGDFVYLHFGAHGTACLNREGQIVWSNQGIKYNHRHGPGGSPVLYDDLLIFSCDGTDVAFVIALDKKTGAVRWKTDRDGPMAYSTPLIIRVNGVDQLISTGGDQVVAYEPKTGREIWKSRYDGYSLIPRPVYGNGLVFICSGWNTPQVYAIRPDGSGDVTDTHVAWSLVKGAPHSPSPILIGDELYLMSDRGIGTCLDAKSGTVHWTERIDGNYSASPLYANGRIYFLNEAGKCAVIQPGKSHQLLAENQIDGRTLASLGVHGSSFYLRSDTHLYRIQSSRR